GARRSRCAAPRARTAVASAWPSSSTAAREDELAAGIRKPCGGGARERRSRNAPRRPGGCGRRRPAVALDVGCSSNEEGLWTPRRTVVSPVGHGHGHDARAGLPCRFPDPQPRPCGTCQPGTGPIRRIVRRGPRRYTRHEGVYVELRGAVNEEAGLV